MVTEEESKGLEADADRSNADAVPEQNEGVAGKKNVKIIAAAVVAVSLVVVAVCCWYFFYEKPHSEAVSGFNSAAEVVAGKNEELGAAMDAVQSVIDSGKKPLDGAVLTAAESSVTVSRASLREIPERPSDTEALLAAAEELSKPLDYSQELTGLKDCKTALENGIKQLEQVTNPSEAFVVERIKEIPTITGVSAVTEDHDPNGKLNKQGGYTATVYFSSSLVDQAKAIGDTIIDKGVDGGGGLEVYATVDDASARDKYLGAFDGSLFDSGSHHVIGTVIVRTSTELTATQQNELEKQIMDSLIALL